MNREEIIRLASEAGIKRCICKSSNCNLLDSVTTYTHLERFAELVAAAEREACAQECDKIERRKWEIAINGGAMSAVGARDCAAAIRARGEK